MCLCPVLNCLDFLKWLLTWWPLNRTYCCLNPCSFFPAHLPWACALPVKVLPCLRCHHLSSSSLTSAAVWQAAGIEKGRKVLQGMAGKEGKQERHWGRWHSPTTTIYSHVSDRQSQLYQRRSQQTHWSRAVQQKYLPGESCFSSTSGAALMTPTLFGGSYIPIHLIPAGNYLPQKDFWCRIKLLALKEDLKQNDLLLKFV